MAEHITLECAHELYGLYSELVLHLELIHAIEPIAEYLNFRREMKENVLTRLVSMGITEPEIPKFYFEYDRSSNSLKLESGILNLHRECLYYCEKFSEGVHLSIDYIAMSEFHRNRIVHIRNRMDDLFILEEIESGKSEAEARAQLAVANAYVERLLASKKVSEAG